MQLSGRQRRRLYEWEAICGRFAEDEDIDVDVTERDGDGIPSAYLVVYHIKSICGIRDDGHPVFAGRFEMELVIPERYPQADAPARFQFVGEIKPWHPNIVYYGETAGTVCVNPMNTFADLAWGIEKVASYLRYERYHAQNVPPFPVDLKVAAWVRSIGEPEGWIFFDQD